MRTVEQRRAFKEIEMVARSLRLPVETDQEGFPVIKGRYGRVEWCGHDGDLAVYTDRRKLFKKLWAIPGVRRHQTGDDEMRAVFSVGALKQVARAIKVRRRRGQVSPRSIANLRPRSTSRLQQASFFADPGQGTGGTPRAPRSARYRAIRNTRREQELPLFTALPGATRRTA